MSSESNPEILGAAKWRRWRDIPLAILAWVAVISVILWGASHILRALVSLLVAALLAFILLPATTFLQRRMPRFLAILIVYLVALAGLSTLCYLIVNTAAHQTLALAQELEKSLKPDQGSGLASLDQVFHTLGISQAQLMTAREQILTHITDIARNSLPLLRGVVDFLIDTIVVSVMSIYLVVDGPHVIRWIRSNAPNVTRANFLLDVMQNVLGGYIRGQLILAALIGLLVGLGMQFIFHLPYSMFLGVLAFSMAFIPVVGTFISGAICVLIALSSQGWLIAIWVLVYFTIVHIIESHTVGPRIVGEAIGLHPVVSLFALIAGAELFGIWGALFASPLAGIIQVLIVTSWREWRSAHPEQFQIHPASTNESTDSIV